MAKTITTKYGTKINVDGLTPEQVKKVRSMAEDNGSYGAKGASLADNFRKQNTTPAATNTPAGNAPAGSTQAGGAGGGQAQNSFAGAPEDAGSLKKKREEILKEIKRRGGKNKAPGFAAQLAEVDKKLSTLRTSGDPAADPGSDEPMGAVEGGVGPGPYEEIPLSKDTGHDGKPDPGTTNTGDSYTAIDNFIENAINNLEPLDLSGAPKILGADDLAGSRQSAYDSLYKQGTQNLERDRGRDLEAQKQELAQRGIPINFDSGGGDLYSKSVNSVNERFDARDAAARDAANVGADARLATLANVNSQASQAFLNNATSKFQSQIDALATSGNLINELMTKYGIDRQEAINKIKIKSDERISKLKASGGGSGSSGSSVIFGGNVSQG